MWSVVVRLLSVASASNVPIEPSEWPPMAMCWVSSLPAYTPLPVFWLMIQLSEFFSNWAVTDALLGEMITNPWDAMRWKWKLYRLGWAVAPVPHTRMGCFTPFWPRLVGRQTVLLAPARASVVTAKGPSPLVVLTGGSEPPPPPPPPPPPGSPPPPG